jgi:hypothetical protein
MRILVVTRVEEPATATEAMAQALLKLGHSVAVATGRYGDSPSNFREDGIKVRRIMSWLRAARSVIWGWMFTKRKRKSFSKIALV